MANEIRERVANGEKMIWVMVDGQECLFLASKFGPAWIATATDEDIMRNLVK